MPRPKIDRHICLNTKINIWKPAGIPTRLLTQEDITIDELSALKIAYQDNLTHLEGANLMKISQSTFTRLVHSACQKITRALTLGHAIQLHETIDLNFPDQFPTGCCRRRQNNDQLD